MLPTARSVEPPWPGISELDLVSKAFASGRQPNIPSCRSAASPFPTPSENESTSGSGLVLRGRLPLAYLFAKQDRLRNLQHGFSSLPALPLHHPVSFLFAHPHIALQDSLRSL